MGLHCEGVIGAPNASKRLGGARNQRVVRRKAQSRRTRRRTAAGEKDKQSGGEKEYGSDFGAARGVCFF